eukprot:PhF_6_TR36494/c2_g1_i2/m.53634
MTEVITPEEKLNRMIQWSEKTQKELNALGWNLPPMPPHPSQCLVEDVTSNNRVMPYTELKWCDLVLRWYGKLNEAGLWPGAQALAAAGQQQQPLPHVLNPVHHLLHQQQQQLYQLMMMNHLAAQNQGMKTSMMLPMVGGIPMNPAMSFSVAGAMNPAISPVAMQPVTLQQQPTPTTATTSKSLNTNAAPFVPSGTSPLGPTTTTDSIVKKSPIPMPPASRVPPGPDSAFQVAGSPALINETNTNSNAPNIPWLKGWTTDSETGPFMQQNVKTQIQSDEHDVQSMVSSLLKLDT